MRITLYFPISFLNVTAGFLVAIIIFFKASFFDTPLVNAPIKLPE